MNQTIKKTLLRLHFCHIIIDKLYDAMLAFKFLLRWRILGRHHQLIMRSSKDLCNGLQDLIRDLPIGITMIEIGSYRGESAEMFLRSGKINKIYCIDPWKPSYDKNDAASYTNMSKVECEFDKRFANDNRVVKEKGTINDFVDKHMRLPKIDFVYIDGCHTEEATINDIKTTLDYIKPSFAIAGHDYAITDVKNAVAKTLTCPNKIYIDTSWIWFCNQ